MHCTINSQMSGGALRCRELQDTIYIIIDVIQLHSSIPQFS